MHLKKNNLLLGSHISLSKNRNYLLGVVEETIHNGANVFMIFTGPPHNTKRTDISELFLGKAINLSEKHNISISDSVVHAPYIINLANPIEENEIFNIDHLVLEINRTYKLGMKYIVLHPGFHINQTLEEGISRIIKNLKIVLEKVKHTNVIICLETMAGKKNQIGSKLEELDEIIKGCNYHPQLGVCLDTVHLHDSGYDVRNKVELLEQINSIVGIDRVKVLHVGDSANEMGSRKDRHANFEYGKIGFKPLLDWIYDPIFSGLPIIIETPFWIYEDSSKKKLISPYKHEISLIRNKKWSPIPDPRFKPR